MQLKLKNRKNKSFKNYRIMSISAADVAKLRQMTGAGMMDCKKALTEADGDMTRASQIIREKGQAIANKRADREASEGNVIAKVTSDSKFGAVIALNCETDFVAKNADFVQLAHDICDIAIANKPVSLDALKAIPFKGKTVGDIVIEQIGIIGEKIELAFYDYLTGEAVQPYIHMGNKLATLAAFNKAGVDVQVYKDVAMQIAAMSPVAVDKGDVPAEMLEEELKIAKEKARLEGKAENMLDKIAQGRIEKFYKESTLLNQAFVKDNKLSIAQMLDHAVKGLTVTGFKRYSLKS
jgi:elongation factor Ts